MEITDTAFEKYARYGISLLKYLVCYFQEAQTQLQRKILDSIFPAKLIFKDGKTSVLNLALTLNLQKNKSYKTKKTKDMIIDDNISGDLARVKL